MKNKLWFLVSDGLKRKTKTKTFKIVNLILLIVLPLLINIDTVIKKVGGDFLTPTKVYVVSEIPNLFETFLKTYENNGGITLSQTDVEFIDSKDNVETLKKEINEDSKNIIINIKENLENIFSVDIISYDGVDILLEQNIVNALNSIKINMALKNSSINEIELAKIYESINIEKIALNEEYNDAESIIKSYGYTLIPILIIPLFILLIFVIQMIGAEINEEKTSKSMEIIISSISPKTHFMSKMITVNIFVILQILLMLVYSSFGLWIRTLISDSSLVESFGISFSSIFELLKTSGFLREVLISLPFILILFLLSIVAYSFLAGILASMTTSIEDFQQLQTPLMILIMVGYYLALMASSFENATFITIFSTVPFISAMLAPVLLLMGQIGFSEIIVSIILLVIVIILFIRYGLRIYKVGILNYETSKLWNKLFKAMKGKN